MMIGARSRVRGMCIVGGLAVLLLPAFAFGQELADTDPLKMLPVAGGEYRHWVDRSSPYQHVISDFELGAYEVTYALWYEVRTWAEERAYTFTHLGKEGLNGAPGAVPTEDSRQPVAGMSWIDAVVWSNAVSEYRGKTPAYYLDGDPPTILRDASVPGARDPLVDWKADGYRLPTEAEWLYVAAYPQEGPYWEDGTYWNITCIPGDLPLLLSQAPEAYAWYRDNAGGSTRSVGQKHPSTLGAYDMGGNVWEWVWDWWAPAADLTGGAVSKDYRGPSDGNERVRRGGSVLNAVGFVVAGSRQKAKPPEAAPATGFRLARSIAEAPEF